MKTVCNLWRKGHRDFVCLTYYIAGKYPSKHTVEKLSQYCTANEGTCYLCKHATLLVVEQHLYCPCWLADLLITELTLKSHLE